MLQKLCVLAVLGAVAVSPALSETAHKDGAYTPFQDPGVPPTGSEMMADWEYNTGGMIDFVPDLGGSSDGWGEWFITTAYNDAGQDLKLAEFGFPCAGPPTGPYGWVVWYDMGGYVPPPGPADTAEDYGPFTPVDPNPETFPPTVYTYVDVSGENMVVADGTFFCFGYDNTGMGGQTSYNGVQTWAWYSGYWDPDEYWGRTAVLQVKANYIMPNATTETTWGAVKALFR
jgi:hypothetical protein